MPNVPKRNRDESDFAIILRGISVPNVPKRNRDSSARADVINSADVPNVPKRNRDFSEREFSRFFEGRCLMYLRGIETLNRFHVTHDLFSCA